ncbi:tetratricopeptide repeat protein [Roseofilum capinflatum]|uniref:Tetratricopeptide repeat protein n=1 Tax=Roseofilum capinflatum BLCC-M114 TaxID=3022440 RepID=A0ABT7B2B8_9CYAN|nr:tetratricopeptide repeat protein [Roseofilum capinflatum]MDJ1173285.1 tetratricopeptide repeat protein [Roseofilum capinflatum BLCC-M114]
MSVGRSLVKLGMGSSCVFGGLVFAGVGGVLADALLSVAAGNTANALDALVDWRNGEEVSLENNDLTKAVGKAIAAVITLEAKRQQRPIRQYLQKIAAQANKNWLRLAQQELSQQRYPELREANLEKFLTPEEYSLTQQGNLAIEEWLTIFVKLDILADPKGHFEIPDPVKQRVAELLHSAFPKALRETLKEDFVTEGKAFAGLTLQLLAGMNAALMELRNSPRGENLDDLTLVLEQFQQLASQLRGTEAQQQSFFNDIAQQIHSGFADVCQQLGVMETTITGLLHNLEESLEQLRQEMRQGFAELSSRLPLPEQESQTPAPREFRLNRYAYRPQTWVGREESGRLGESLRGECRILIVTGITGQGKTALAECIAVTELAHTGLKPIRINFDYGSWQQGFDGFLVQFWETLTGKPLPPQTPSKQRFNQVVAKLRKEGYLLLFDSMEKLLQPKTGRMVDSVFADEGWWRLFEALLVGESCQSRVIITSQDRLTQFDLCKQDHFWQEEPLEGLAENEQQQLFRQWFENKEIKFPEDEESLGYLQQIGRAFEGHPLVIKVVVRELLAKPFQGNVKCYWREFGKSFTEEDSRNRHQNLERKVKKRVREVLSRLREDEAVAYWLLVRGAVYRKPVEKLFYVAMGEEWGEDAAWQALELLQLRALVQATATDEKLLLRQHNLIHEVALEELREAQEWHSVQEQAAQIWLREYEPPAEASNLETVRGYLEAFYHYCQAEKWEASVKIMQIRLDTPTKEPLHNQLDTWGYYWQRLEIYTQLLGKVSQNYDPFLCCNIGVIFYHLGEYEKSKNYFHKCLAMTREMGDQIVEEIALNNLGNIYNILGNNEKAMIYFQQHSAIAKKTGDRLARAKSSINMGHINYSLGEYQTAREHYQQALVMFREIGNQSGEGAALANLGFICIFQEEYDQAMKYLQPALKIAREIGDRAGEAYRLQLLGDLFIKVQDYSQGKKYLQEALNISINIGCRENMYNIYLKFSSLYMNIGNVDLSIRFVDKALNCAKSLGIHQASKTEDLLARISIQTTEQEN